MKPFVLETFRIQSDVVDRDFEITVFSSGKADIHRPLFIFHDGQNLFKDEKATYGRSWRLLDVLTKYDFPDCVFAGITCGDGFTRFDDYCPFPFDAFAQDKTGADSKVGGYGDRYLHFVYSELLPILHTRYPSQDRIVMGGSSLGGYISTVAALRYPAETKGIIALSNAFWVAVDPLIDLIEKKDGGLCRMYLDIGDKESDEPEMNRIVMEAQARVVEAIKAKNPVELRTEIIENGTHNEASWGDRIEEILRWFIKL
ncbi:MAG: alpha/beta hydrolase [Erysipelotrichaceae bacterium]